MKQDYAQALKRYAKAAELGSLDSQKYLGHLFYEGKVTKRNFCEAFKYFSKGAEQGNASCKKAVGLM